MKKDINWFKDWFNSKHYHVLYKHRDYSEAEDFINRLVTFLNLSEGQKVLDLACGKGRHSIFLNQKGLDVIGLDLSSESIAYAKDQENDYLRFYRADMRDFDLNVHFDTILNLFTSFGYFKTKKEDQVVIKNIVNHLNPKGKLIIDYLNCKKIISILPSNEKISREGIDFEINKSIHDDFIVKDIRFEFENEQKHYKEFVKIIDLNTFRQDLENSGLIIKNVFGDYQLRTFDEKNSDRLIIVAEKR